MSAGQRSFLFDYLCENVPQTSDVEARNFVRSLAILPTFNEARRRPAEDALLCSQELLSTLVGDITLLPESLLVCICYLWLDSCYLVASSITRMQPACRLCIMSTRPPCRLLDERGQTECLPLQQCTALYCNNSKCMGYIDTLVNW